MSCVENIRQPLSTQNCNKVIVSTNLYVLSQIIHSYHLVLCGILLIDYTGLVGRLVQSLSINKHIKHINIIIVTLYQLYVYVLKKIYQFKNILRRTI